MTVHPIQEHALHTRRNFLATSASGLGGLASLALLQQDGLLAAEPLAARPSHSPAPAKNCIFIFLAGAPSHLDLYDPKPALAKYDGQPCPEEFIQGKRFAFLRGHPNLAASRFPFAKCGQSGQELSELLPHLAGVADELTVVRTLHTDEFNHGPAQLFLHTGFEIEHTWGGYRNEPLRSHSRALIMSGRKPG